MYEGLDLVVACARSIAAARTIIAIAGPPGAGKSTFAAALAQALNESEAGPASIVPMDGFHLDDGVLRRQGTLDRKGAPFTFDLGGLISLLRRLRDNAEPGIAVPVFDRSLEISRAGAAIVAPSTRILIVEGNYLLLDDPDWAHLRPFFDLTLMLQEDPRALDERLIGRWLAHGFDPEAARAKVAHNDLPNVDLVLTQSVAADIALQHGRATFVHERFRGLVTTSAR